MSFALESLYRLLPFLFVCLLFISWMIFPVFNTAFVCFFSLANSPSHLLIYLELYTLYSYICSLYSVGGLVLSYLLPSGLVISVKIGKSFLHLSQIFFLIVLRCSEI